jgi:flagellar basal-body rod protein FlgC
MGLSALGAGLSGLRTNQQALAVEAHNVANLSTANFQPQKATFRESAPAGNGVTLSVEGLSQSATAAGTDLAASITNSLIYEADFKLNAKVIQAADERIGTLIDIRA